MTDLIEQRPVLEQLAEAVKWWNSEEAEEPDVRRLFAACKAEIERLQSAESMLREFVTALAYDDSNCCWGCGYPEEYKLRAKGASDIEIAEVPWLAHEDKCLMDRARKHLRIAP